MPVRVLSIIWKGTKKVREMSFSDDNVYMHHVPRIVAWEITRRCNLFCRHCRASSDLGPYPGELSTEKSLQVIDEIARVSRPILILTGGDPMLREDIYEIARYATDKGLRVVMAPCGTLLSERNVKRIKDAGIRRISLSIDGANEKTHDSFRRVKGSFAEILDGIKWAKKGGLEFQVNTTITKLNLHELPEILNLAVNLGAVAFHPFLLVPTGRGRELAEFELSPREYEETLNWFYEQRERFPIQLKPTCAPHYFRILIQRSHGEGKRFYSGGYGMDALTKGCIGGQSFCFISYRGEVQICGFLNIKCGELMQESFSHIWENSPIFKDIRNIDGYRGRCGYCEYRKFCGGCRARAYEYTGDYLAEEPFCLYEPKREFPSHCPSFTG
jgi:heme b synthase